jgi:asparagine synthase (glutamine-hydrolysing)
MAGIYGVFLKEKRIDTFYKNMSKNPVIDEYQIKEGLVGRSTIDKLQKDRFFETRNDVTICFEGVNLSDQIKTTGHFFIEYQEKGILFIDQLKGSYSGFVLDERENKIYIFNDHLSTKNIFYYYHKNLGFIFASELKAISKFFKCENRPFSLDEESVYMMALYGFLLEDHTYIKEVKKLPYSSTLTFDFTSLDINIKRRQKYSNQKNNHSHKEAAYTINSHMEKSVEKSWRKDLEYTDKHLSLLSGGMDARTNIMLAKYLDFEKISTITFGQSKSKDVEYAQKIAIGEKLNHHQRILDYPNYLIDDIFENYIVPNDGLIMYHSSAHASSTIKSFNLEDYALLHTGQFGDSLFGSFTKPGFNFISQRGKIGYTGFVSDNNLLDKITMLPDFLNKYQELGYEVYNYEQRQINATLYGDRCLNNLIDNISPFCDLDLMKYCLALPEAYKKDQIIYYTWLKQHHENILEYPWEKIEMSPNSMFKIIYGTYFKRYFNGAKKYFKLNYDSMNPYEVWMKKFPFILQELDSIIEREINNTILSNEIREDLKKIYEKNIFENRNKFAVVTALLAIKLHFE